MKKLKSLKLMLLGLLAIGSTSAFAQRNVGDIFPAGNFVYEVTAEMVGSDPGAVTLIGVRQGYNPVVNNVLEIPGQMSAVLFDDTYTFNVTAIGTTPLPAKVAGNTGGFPALTYLLNAKGEEQGTFAGRTSAQSVVFPKEITEIPVNCLSGYTNMNAISFEANSQLSTINNGAFATTQISTFDFSNCELLAALPNEVFVEAGKKNSYITSITLPRQSLLLKDIQGAFKNLVNLEEIVNLEYSAITQVVANAFENDAKLKTVSLPGTVETIAAGAFIGSGIENLTIDVTSLQTLGNGASTVYQGALQDGTAANNITTLKSLTLKGNLGGVIQTNAFKGATNLETVNVSALNFASKGQIASNAFEGCNNANFKSITFGDINDQPTGGFTIEANAFLNCDKLETVAFGTINSANAINGLAFAGCTNLATVTLGDVLAAGAIGDGTNPVFGNALKTVTIGTVKAGNIAIKAEAFQYANVKGATLKIATGTGEYVSSDDASTPILAVNAFNFDAIDGSLTGWVDATDAAVVTIGEIKSKGGVFAANAATQGVISGTQIREIIFSGDIAQGGIGTQIYDDGANAVSLKKITFNGNLAQNAIKANAFAHLADNAVTVTFNGSLAKEAIMNGAFELMKGATTAASIILNGTPEDATVNPFQKNAFDFTTPADVDTPRDIYMTVANAALLAQFKSATKGLGTNGAFDVYRVDFYVAPPYVDLSFTAFRNASEQNVAWTRWELGSRVDANVTGSLTAGQNLKIQRVQDAKKWNANKDGVDSEGKVKVTLYGTYTDEDDALNASTIYMVPLKVTNGYYYIPGTNTQTLIAKVEKVSGNFSVADVKVPVTVAAGPNSVWTGLTNTELHIAQNVMTNQQLVDKTASDGVTPVDIYRGGTTIAEDLYVMTDPAKYKGFRIDKIIIEKKTDGTGAYIGEGWYYMLLKHYNGTATAAPRVVWLDDFDNTDPLTAIKQMKSENTGNVANGNNAIYTLQGVRVSEPVKGQIYIKNGKKYIAK